ncbi:hypothetical protein [Tepidibacter mesophilus]|nr:hypothetical protein [Tepidibacter mesophilus]
MIHLLAYFLLYTGLGVSWFCILCVLFNANLKFKCRDLEIELEGKLSK